MMPTRSPIQFTVPGIPQRWERARHAGKHHYTKTSMEAAKQEIQVYWVDATTARERREVFPHEGLVHLTVDSCFECPQSWPKWKQQLVQEHFDRNRRGIPKLSTPDVDNHIKLVMDALNGLAYKDDAQVYSVHGDKVWLPRGVESHMVVHLHFAPDPLLPKETQ